MKLLCLLLILVTVPAFAEVNMLTTGYDYVLMSDKDKFEFVAKMLHILQRDIEKTEDTIVALDGLYYIYSKEVEGLKNYDAAIKAVFDRPVMQLLAELLTMEAPKSYDEEFLKKYDLKLKK